MTQRVDFVTAWRLMKVLLITPPLTQLNTAYPATTMLTGFLRSQNIQATQADLSIELIDRIFSKIGLNRIRDEIVKGIHSEPVVLYFLDHFSEYESVVESVIGFLRGKSPSLAHRILSDQFLPRGPFVKKILSELDSNDYRSFAFGSMGLQDHAKYLATLFIDELTQVIRFGVDARFELSKYAEKLAASSISFTPIEEALNEKTLIDEMIEELTVEFITRENPDLVCLTVPFPGNLIGALRIAKKTRDMNPKIKIAMGGGYVNTELRTITDSRIFNYIDYITLDDGERPLLQLIGYLKHEVGEHGLVRTFMRSAKGIVEFYHSKDFHDIPAKDTGFPTYDGLPLQKYLSVLEMLNPMHRIWSVARWNKLMVAHGCYWKKCNFCDTSLDYINRYDPVAADILIDRMQKIITETGETGFHFVDEAAPPSSLKNLSLRMIERGLNITWWGNLRFDSVFTKELAELMARAGCVAVTGGLEVASDRLLKLMNKGVSIEQVARVTKNFNRAGIRVHAYLMYGFPTQTIQETVDSLEVVRQLFIAGCLDSAYWHRFSATAHSPIGKNPSEYSIEVKNPEPLSGEGVFAINDLPFLDPLGIDHEMLGRGLKKALYNYMHGMGLEEDVRVWFEAKVPKPNVTKNKIESLDLVQTN